MNIKSIYYSHPIRGRATTFLGSIASKHAVDIPSTSFCNCSCKLSISDDAISTIIINEKCPPRSWAWDAPTFPPFAVTIRVTSATIPGRSTPTVLIMILFFEWDENDRVVDVDDVTKLVSTSYMFRLEIMGVIECQFRMIVAAGAASSVVTRNTSSRRVERHTPRPYNRNAHPSADYGHHRA